VSNLGILKVLTDSVSGTFANQWKKIITVETFDEHTVVAPGILNSNSNNVATNIHGSNNIISNGSKIFVPENTAAFIFGQGGIENIVTTPGGYEYQDGEESVFNGDGMGGTILRQVKERIGYGGIAPIEKKIAFINLREIRDIKFGTRGPQVYNDSYYGCDLEIYAYGSFSIKIVDSEVFIKNFVPANTNSYSFGSTNVRAQVISEFLQSFIVALNSLSNTYRISQLPSRVIEMSKTISEDKYNAGSWRSRFGFEITKVTIENIELSPDSRVLVNQFAANKMSIKAFENVSQMASDIAAQQKIAQGIQKNGIGNGGTLLGINLAQNLSRQGQSNSSTNISKISFDEQIETLKKLKELVDMGVLTEEEFSIKKREVTGL
jgi:membrane protease subunit (stomatin/prohibitin family)